MMPVAWLKKVLIFENCIYLAKKPRFENEEYLKYDIINSVDLLH